jgi:hypothetical protein
MTDPQLEVGSDGPSALTHDRIRTTERRAPCGSKFGAEMDARPQQVDSATAPSVARRHYGPSPRGPRCGSADARRGVRVIVPFCSRLESNGTQSAHSRLPACLHPRRRTARTGATPPTSTSGSPPPRGDGTTDRFGGRLMTARRQTGQIRSSRTSLSTSSDANVTASSG